jgi:iron transport multicopper oxidase
VLKHAYNFRPPPVVATQGDKVIMHVTNTLGESGMGTALHTHGMFFNGSNWADGAVSTTQCPIPPNQTLSYEIDTSLQVRRQGTLSPGLVTIS